MSKSRKLQELHLSKHWDQLSEIDHAKAEKDIIAALVAHRDEKRLYEMEWTCGIKAGEYFEDEQHDGIEELEYENSEVQDECEGSEWTTCSEEEDDADDPAPGHTPTFGKECEEI